MAVNDVRDALRAAILDVKPDADLPSEDDAFGAKHMIEDIGLDSLDVINLLFSLEEQFEVKISETDIDDRELMNCANLIAFVAGD